MLALAAALLTFADLDPAIRKLVGMDAAGFDRWIAAVETDTARRLQQGERDHLVFYMLQSSEFTREPRVEPALSAREYHESGRVPETVARRIAALQPKHSEDLVADYQRAMRFLYEKEFASRARQGAGRREHVASLYQRRGHSTDTSPDSTKAMVEGLALIRQPHHDPKFAPRRVLLIGPGLDWAPRTGHRDGVEPRTYQPEALRRALGPDAVIHCADINPRVVDHIRKAAQPGITAERWNILTRKPEGPPYDLVIATNVLLYFDARELLLAVNNIAAATAPGGWFLHNDQRGEMETYTSAAGLTLEDARMVRLSDTRELFDSVALHRRRGAP
jgi:hypothetical protein